MKEPGTTRKKMFWISSAFKLIHKKGQKYVMNTLGHLKTLNYAYNLNVKMQFFYNLLELC